MRVSLVAQHDVTDHLLLTRRSISNYTSLAGEDHDVEFGNSDTGPDDLADVKSQNPNYRTPPTSALSQRQGNTATMHRILSSKHGY